MKVLLLGAAGQLGNDIVETWRDDEILALKHDECDVVDRPRVLEAVARASADIVIDNAAYVRVDEAEKEPLRAFAVNAEGAKNVADAAVKTGAAVVYISTDYVFGVGREPHREDELVSPRGAYATSKAAGEALVRETTDRHFIARSSGLYGSAGSSGKGGNFVETMLRFAAEGRSWKVVADEILSPTYTLDLAQKLRELVATGAFGTYHLTNSGECSWYEFAVEATRLGGFQADVSPTTSVDWGAPAPRPAYSVLAANRLGALGIDPMRPWQEALAAYVGERP
jgi:dTDP-4-dehydrorhamnose reductase